MRRAALDAGIPPDTMSPWANARPESPPVRLRTCVERLPRTAGTSIPPAIARYCRAPLSRSPKDSVLPRDIQMAVQRRAGFPLSIGERSPPVNATIASDTNRISGPLTVISRAAAPSALPTRRLARHSAMGSIAPPTGIPKR